MESGTQNSGGRAIARVILAALAGIVLALALVQLAEAAGESTGWRLRIKDAAVVRGDAVLLGEIADPVGPLDPALWQKLAASRLWESPPEGRPVSMTKPKLQQAMAAYAGELSALCIYPASITLQRGGAILYEDDLRSLVVKTLTPHLGRLPGEASFSDFRLPASVFLNHSGQNVELEGPFDLVPGRCTLRLAVKEMDGVVVRRLTGTVFVDIWANVPTASSPMNRGDILSPGQITFERKNLAHLREAPWDGKGGPWRVVRPIGAGQTIHVGDLGVVPAVTRGATVTMLYEGKNFRLAIPGEAMADAAIGESVAVRNLQSKKQVYGVVRDGLTVVVR
ncbi:flagellar basal body P-ring formation chaperone FlgA [Desulfovibrio sp. OttesenSCG-928-I05]|nr:flagellar basal body P-ring formation chaperone FlgA [Desulfovibrio sp. OttesenSCG-928-I05]